MQNDRYNSNDLFLFYFFQKFFNAMISL